MFEIPQKTLSQINEFSSGGFVLFTFDEDGNPRMASQFDSIPHAAAMQYFIYNWSKVLNSANTKLIFKTMFGDDDPGESSENLA